MEDEWQTTTLGKIVKDGSGFIQTGPFGSQLHASDYVKDGIPVVMPVNLADNRVNLTDIARITEEDASRLSKHLVKKGDILYSRRGDVTRKALITDSEVGMFCGTGCLLVRPGNKIDPRFLAYHLSSPKNQEWIIRHAIGATMPNLNTGILSDVPLRVPSRALQRAIAHILGSLDDKIKLALRRLVGKVVSLHNWNRYFRYLW
ncbi:MAG: restriction endonuclease subunit S [Candidatus Electrothrix scaldis]|nr:MAG: restriction endonuclease subunit S [Candidatus Electrothrix sp. GW3-3]